MNDEWPERRAESWRQTPTQKTPEAAKLYGWLPWMTVWPSRIKTEPKMVEVLTHRAPGPAMLAVPNNVRRFRDRPLNALAALLPSKDAAQAACDGLRTAGVGMSGAHLLSGMEGSRILDRYWTRPRRRWHPLPDLRTIGYYDVMLGLYGSGLRGHGAVLVLPSAPTSTGPIRQVLNAHGGQVVTYFGRSTLEKL